MVYFYGNKRIFLLSGVLSNIILEENTNLVFFFLTFIFSSENLHICTPGPAFKYFLTNGFNLPQDSMKVFIYPNFQSRPN